MIFITMKNLIRKYIQALYEADGFVLPYTDGMGRPSPEIDESDDEELDEFASMGGGSIQGLTLPLGMSAEQPKDPFLPGSSSSKKRSKRRHKKS
jgi:hypothetical protein